MTCSELSMEHSFVLGPYDKILLLGGGEILRNLCQWARPNLYAVSVITSPRHAEEKVNSETLDQFLRARGIPFLITENIAANDVREFIGVTEKTFCLSLGSAWIFKKNVISGFFNDRLFNCHGSRLPQNRGGGGFSWQVLTANRFGFCTLHLIDEGIDQGDIVCSEEFLFPPTSRIPRDYENIYIEKNTVFLTELLMAIRKGTKKVVPKPQTECLSTYWPRLNTLTDGWIDWKQDALSIERFICAFDEPYAGAQSNLNGKTVHLKSVSLNLQDGVFHAFQAGLIYRKSKQWLCVCTNGGALIVERVLDPAGKNLFDSIRVGDRLHTPIEKLETAKQRVVYTPNGITPVIPASINGSLSA